MINIFYFYVTGNIVNLNEVSEGAYLGWKNPYQQNMDLHTYGFIYRVRYKNLTKFIALKHHILDALFISQHVKDELIKLFSLVQRANMAFSHLARIYKVKRAKRFDIDCDLYTTPFNTIPSSVLTDVYDDLTQTIYRFRLSDILALTNKALYNAPEFFVEPLHTRNPYTNMPFTKAQLYHIYFAVKNSPLVMPTLFHLYFMSHFDLQLFLRNNECILLNYAIDDFVKNGSEDEHAERIYEMIEQYEEDLGYLNISNGFPQDKLLCAFSPYLQDYLLASYSLLPTLRKHSRRRLRLSLIKFGKKNPLFGRRIYMSSQAHYIDASV